MHHHAQSCVRVYMYVRARMRTPWVNAARLPLSLSILFFATGVLIKPEAD